jgi:hypothetical protein
MENRTVRRVEEKRGGYQGSTTQGAMGPPPPVGSAAAGQTQAPKDAPKAPVGDKG